MGTNCAPLVTDLFYTATKETWILLTMTIKLMLSRLLIRLLDDLLNIDNPYFEGMVKQIYPPELLMLSRLLIRLLDDLLNIDNPYFEGMVKQIYPPELQLNKANNTDTEAPFYCKWIRFF